MYKYKFNPESLSYDRIHVKTRRLLLKYALYTIAVLVFAMGFHLLYSALSESPEETRLKQDLQRMQVQYDLVSKKMDQVETVLEDLQQRDNNIYRAIFEAPPVFSESSLHNLNSLRRYQTLEGYDNEMLMEYISERIDLISKEVYTQSLSYDEIVEKALQKDSAWTAIPAIQPMASKDLKYISSGFGMRMHPIYKIMRMHNGLDFSAPVGTEVYATADGKVVETDLKGRTANGLKVVIDHGNGYVTYYAHLSRVIARTGQKVKRGQVVGLVGNTGVSSGPHLHYEVHKNDRAVNPLNYFFNDLSPQEYAAMTEEASMAQSFD